MDSHYTKKNHEIPKFPALKGNTSPLMIRGRFHHHQPISSFNSYSPENIFPSTESSLAKYFVSNSPLAAGDTFNSPATGKFQFGSSSSGRRSPVLPLAAVENLEAVDGVLVGSVAAGGRVSRSGSDSGSVGGGTSLSSSPSSNSTLCKAEICRDWEDFGHCRFGSKCQFAHGKEELRPTLFPARSKSELSKPYTSAGTHTFGPKSRFAQRVMAQLASPMKPGPVGKSPTIKLNPEHAAKTPTLTAAFKDTSKILFSDPTPTTTIKTEFGNKTTTITMGDYWLPHDDGIEFTLPSHAEKPQSREDVDAYIQCILHGPSKRLPVFNEICPE